MYRIPRKRTIARRLPLLTSAAIGAVLLTAVPASAHVEAQSDGAQALAENVKIDFEAESESDTAGITKLRVVLPEGIAPADVTYGEGPEGWKFTPSDDGYTVEGPAVKVGENAEYSITVRQLPDAKEIAFKTLQTYSDDRTDRWIELDENGENPAPVLELKPAAPGAKPASPSPSETDTAPAPASSQPSEPPASPAAQAEEKDDEGGLSAMAWVGIGAAVVLVAAAVVFLLRRRAGTGQ